MAVALVWLASVGRDGPDLSTAGVYLSANIGTDLRKSDVPAEKPIEARQDRMIRAVEIPPVVQPQVWNLIFNRRPTSPWQGWIVPGEFKHVRAYAYVPGMHVWVFYDPHIARTDIFLARDGAHADVVKVWLGADGEQISMKLQPTRRRWFPCGFWCVPAIKHLLGLRSGALRPDALYRHCLANGGMPFEASHEGPNLRSAPA